MNGHVNHSARVPWWIGIIWLAILVLGAAIFHYLCQSLFEESAQVVLRNWWFRAQDKWVVLPGIISFVGFTILTQDFVLKYYSLLRGDISVYHYLGKDLDRNIRVFSTKYNEGKPFFIPSDSLDQNQAQVMTFDTLFRPIPVLLYGSHPTQATPLRALSFSNFFTTGLMQTVTLMFTTLSFCSIMGCYASLAWGMDFGSFENDVVGFVNWLWNGNGLLITNLALILLIVGVVNMAIIIEQYRRLTKRVGVYSAEYEPHALSWYQTKDMVLEGTLLESRRYKRKNTSSSTDFSRSYRDFLVELSLSNLPSVWVTCRVRESTLNKNWLSQFPIGIAKNDCKIKLGLTEDFEIIPYDLKHSLAKTH
ncbi:MAG: hypothetical protein KI790_13910 [Cyclobacteriaceae bacterium]|nr:hypothetical protein [Cyclobacteriaceae bacterium HetDA_MAG_MS6]